MLDLLNPVFGILDTFLSFFNVIVTLLSFFPPELLILVVLAIGIFVARFIISIIP